MTDKRITPLPRPSKGDGLTTGIKMALDGIPFVGGSMAEAFGYYGQRKSQQRQAEFSEEVIEALEAVQADIENLTESTWTTIFQAIEIARRTHQKSKRDALKNAAVNSTKPTAPDEDMQHIFVNMVDEFTPLHLRIFSFLIYPQKFNSKFISWRDFKGLNPNNPSAAWDAIEKYAAPSVRRDLINRCIADLVNRGLLAYSGDPAPLQGAILPEPGDFAWDFYLFITQEGSDEIPGVEPQS